MRKLSAALLALVAALTVAPAAFADDPGPAIPLGGNRCTVPECWHHVQAMGFFDGNRSVLSLASHNPDLWFFVGVVWLVVGVVWLAKTIAR
jgi:hypothetical protein